MCTQKTFLHEQRTCAHKTTVSVFKMPVGTCCRRSKPEYIFETAIVRFSRSNLYASSLSASTPVASSCPAMEKARASCFPPGAVLFLCMNTLEAAATPAPPSCAMSLALLPDKLPPDSATCTHHFLHYGSLPASVPGIVTLKVRIGVSKEAEFNTRCDPHVYAP
jgi:hypothetical protein